MMQRLKEVENQSNRISKSFREIRKTRMTMKGGQLKDRIVALLQLYSDQLNETLDEFEEKLDEMKEEPFNYKVEGHLIKEKKDMHKALGVMARAFEGLDDRILT